jgi:hypothetical protein
MQIGDRFQPGTISWTVEDWRPDTALIQEGDRYLGLALRCWSGSMTDLAMRRRLEHVAAEVHRECPEPPAFGPTDAADAFARHCVAVGMKTERILKLLAYLAVRVPSWLPDDPAEIVSLACAALAREEGEACAG